MKKFPTPRAAALVAAMMAASMLAGTAQAQHQHHDGMDMSGMEMPGMDMPKQDMAEQAHDQQTAAHRHDAPALSTEGSGTSRLPGKEGPMRGLHYMAGDWMLMAHGQAQFNYTDHDGPRGSDLPYVTSMAMLGASRDLGGARLQLRSMLSLEPIMPARGYPNLLATGETANGLPIVDRQHPHDLFMELAARVDVDVAPGTSLFLYGGPVGEPALGPSAFLHRGSAQYTPEPPITHHWFDSTHITYGVVTAGISLPKWQFEASAFRGKEPDEERWNIETPKLDSWSVRASWNPTPNWSAQISHGFLKQPEATHPGENEHRTTASVHYADGKLSAMAAFSNKTHGHGENDSAWIAEANYDLSRHHSLFARYENAKNPELFPDHSHPLHDQPFRVGKLMAGYAWNTPLGNSPFHLSLGGSANAYFTPAALNPYYGRNPLGYTLFTRLSLGH